MIRPLSLALLSACSPLTNDLIHVRHDGAVLPVMVRGNTDAGTLVVYEAGGPFGGGIEERLLDYQGFADTLEPHLAIAAYDRRGYGNAYGTYDPDDIRLGAYVDDLDAVVLTLQERYAPDRTVLLGHSWGGLLTATYLVDHGSERVDAWIDVSGAILTGGDDVYVPYRRDFACRVAAEPPEPSDDVLWSDLLAWCDANPTVDPESAARDELWTYLDAIYELVGDPPLPLGPLLGAVFGSPYNVTDSHLTPNRISRPLYEDTRELDLLSNVHQIDVPSLIVAGELDDVIPSEVGRAVAAEVPDASFVEIPDAGHYVTWPDPQPFADEVLGFLGD